MAENSRSGSILEVTTLKGCNHDLPERFYSVRSPFATTHDQWARRFAHAVSGAPQRRHADRTPKSLGAAPHERTEERTGHANGFKGKTLNTGIGQITLAVPQVREVNGQGGGFYPQSLERGTRSERALKLALAEMYVQGVSTRKVAAITEQLCGFAVSSGQVSQAAQQLDETLEAWLKRPLAACPYVYLDARYERVRQAGLVQKAAVLIAVGVDAAGKRSVLGVSVALSEHEVHWREFLQSLVARGLCGVRLVVSDAHEGLKAARLAVFGGVPWQRCQFHLHPNKASTERFGVCAQAGHESTCRGRHSGHLQRSG